MGQDKHGTRLTWDKTNMGKDKRRTYEEMWDMTNMGQDKHKTRLT